MSKRILLFIIIALPIGAAFFINSNLLSARISPADYSLNQSEKLVEEQLQASQEITDSQEDERDNECIKKINGLNQEELKSIEGVGKVYAERIIEKEINSLESLKNVDGIGDVIAGRIEKFVCEGEFTEVEDEKDEEVIENEEGRVKDEKAKVEISEKDLILLLELVSDLKESQEKEEAEKPKQEKEKTIDINEDGKEDLQEITGIGPTYAERIIEKRPFCKLEELTEVSGIGESRLKEIKNQDLVTIDECNDDKIKIQDQNYKEDEKTQKDEKIEGLKEEVSILEEDYNDLRLSLRDAKREVEEVEEKYSSKLITAQRQRDRCRPDQININKADKSQLKELSNVGKDRAKEIFKSDKLKTLEDAAKIDGIGEKTVEDWIKEGVVCTWGDKIEDDDQSDEGSKKIEINSADKDLLTDIHGIGDSIGERIIDYRKSNCFFELEDLAEIDGIGESTIEEIKNKEPAKADPPIDCFKNKLTVSAERKSDEHSLLILEFFDFKNLDYNLSIKKDDAEKVSQNIILDESLKEKVFELNIDENDNLEILIEKKEKVVIEKEIEIKPPKDNLYRVKFIDNYNREGLEIKVFKSEEMKEKVESGFTEEDGEMSKKLQKDSYHFKVIKESHLTYKDYFDLKKDKEIIVDLKPIKNKIKNSNFASEKSKKEDAKYWSQDNSYRTRDRSKDGKWSIVQKDINASYSRSVKSKKVEVEPGKYNFGGYYYLKETDEDPADYSYLLRIYWFDEDGKEIDNDPYHGNNFKEFNKWTQTNLQSKAPQEVKWAKLKLRSRYDKNKSTDIYWDNFYLKPAE